MTPEDYEQQVGAYFKDKGYAVKVSSYTNDYGIDVFASKNKEKIAVQVKMYGSGIRPINRKMIMELCGAKHYFDCTSAKFVTDGRVLSDAQEVADKLNIEIIYLEPNKDFKTKSKKTDLFSEIWQKHIIPLENKTITRANGKTNKILTVDWSGVQRITSNGNKSVINIEIFKQVIKNLQQHGEITRKAINDDYPGRASSGVCLILSQVPHIKYCSRPAKLIWKK